MKLSTSARRSVLGFAAALAISSALVMPTLAATGPDNTVTQEITSTGVLSAYVSNAEMDSVVYSNTVNYTDGDLTLHVDDQRGTSDGWSVTVASSAFLYGGGSTLGQNIPNTGFVIGQPDAPTMTAGQPVDAVALHGPYAVTGGSLNTARTTITANDGFGSGTYEQNLPVTLEIPAYSQTGTYTATLTVSISSAP